ncbi:sigma-70 family RNA polymerase sigma factor [Petroclostridium sp. X23]|uniref:RNA polymerase sigma factor n=1 Tax=Petroclostridium sp. X23 TaxID=3045146 RepID=UPI0024AD8094|nr:sigma-70 family RNA polymerase sigma factor [Petroclostridium sp. X23]WHH57130.1 sigma-70 family RNA polymerase sigma factor [Petroclostridium sp. X23]
MTADLVIKAKQGDEESLVQLIMLQKQDYYKLAYVYMKNEEDALDAIEDMIVTLYENIYRLKNNEAFYSWSKTILINRCKALLKKKKKVMSIECIQEERYEENLYQKDDQIVLEQHLSRLNGKHQEVLKLRYFLDLDYQSIAQILKVPLGTVKSRIYIGLKKLRESIGGERS